LTLSVDFCEEDGEEGEPVEVVERDGQSLIITREMVEATQPTKCAFNNPAAWQKDKASLGLSMFSACNLMEDASACSDPGSPV